MRLNNHELLNKLINLYRVGQYCYGTAIDSPLGTLILYIDIVYILYNVY